MSDLLKIFTVEFMNGVKETPKMYFAPISAMFKVVYCQAMGGECVLHHRNKKDSEKKKKDKTAA